MSNFYFIVYGDLRAYLLWPNARCFYSVLPLFMGGALDGSLDFVLPLPQGQEDFFLNMGQQYVDARYQAEENVCISMTVETEYTSRGSRHTQMVFLANNFLLPERQGAAHSFHYRGQLHRISAYDEAIQEAGLQAVHRNFLEHTEWPTAQSH